MNSAAMGQTTARKLLEQFGLLTMPFKAKKQTKTKTKPAVDKAAGTMPPSAPSAFRKLA
jgi:hypothetical protein